MKKCNHLYEVYKIDSTQEWFSLMNLYTRDVTVLVKCSLCGKIKTKVITQSGRPVVKYPKLPKLGDKL